MGRRKRGKNQRVKFGRGKLTFGGKTLATWRSGTLTLKWRRWKAEIQFLNKIGYLFLTGTALDRVWSLAGRWSVVGQSLQSTPATPLLLPRIKVCPCCKTSCDFNMPASRCTFSTTRSLGNQEAADAVIFHMPNFHWDGCVFHKPKFLIKWYDCIRKFDWCNCLPHAKLLSGLVRLRASTMFILHSRSLQKL